MSGEDESSWAWLGLLKWSLSYSDGTAPSSETLKMTEDDKKFLEAVMKEGIIDENERMKVILAELTKALDVYKTVSENPETAETAETMPDEDELSDLLMELRDIVEQIDYARAFAAMKGLPFLLGCSRERKAVPKNFRAACLGIMATMCQNNPPVQLNLLELGSIRILSDLFYAENTPSNDGQAAQDQDGKLRAKIIQALSANVRNHTTAEQVFCEVEQAPHLLASALGVYSETENTIPTSSTLRRRALFFLRALITSDTSSPERVRLFSESISYIIKRFLDDEKESDAETRELALELLLQILEQKHSVNAILDQRDFLSSLGTRRISAINALTGEEREYSSVELETWEKLTAELARTERDQPTPSQAAPMMITDGGNSTATEALPLPQ